MSIFLKILVAIGLLLLIFILHMVAFVSIIRSKLEKPQWDEIAQDLPEEGKRKRFDVYEKTFLKAMRAYIRCGDAE